MQKDREKVFWLLKKYSSLTVWESLGRAYKKFTNAWEYAMEHARDDDIDEFNIGATKRILNGQIAFEKGLSLLKKGQRSVFRNTPTAYLRIAANQLVFIDRIMDPLEYDFDWMKNKADIVALAKELKIQQRGLFLVFENDDPSDFGINWELIFDSLFQPFNFPTSLPSVPSALSVTVVSGEKIGANGVWEPEWDDSAAAMESEDNIPKGCMNYLLVGATAPKYKIANGTSPIDVTWRLIWEDHRYEDGTIPEEEKYYLAKPEPEEKAAFKAMPGETCSKNGYWVVRHHDQTKRYFKQGDVFPELNLPNAATIWRFVKD